MNDKPGKLKAKFSNDAQTDIGKRFLNESEKI